MTGASSGIGAATATLLASQGHRVVGAARRTGPIEKLPGVTAVGLDLTDSGSITSAVDAATGKLGKVDVLINNAGYGQFGSIEETPIDQARRQLEVNVVGLIALTQQLIGPMREAGRGRIVNVSSLAGEFSSPMAGWYHASKFALEALSDSMRLELGQFGIDVVVVQPGPVRTPWHDDALSSLDEASSEGPYAGTAQAVARYHRAAKDLPVTSSIETAAEAIVRAATIRRPRPRYRVGRGAGTAVALSRLPDRAFDAMTKQQFGITRTRKSVNASNVPTSEEL
ncbi:MAG TPA: SDR family NAD(P)-dependent oxidoreductase [Microlunatus sp.]